MGGVAALARELGHDVEGSDANVYPPMSTQLEQLGITLSQGYQPEHISADADVVVIGNAMTRGNPAVEAVLDARRPYTSGAEWLRDQVDKDHHMIAHADLELVKITDDLDEVIAWIEKSLLDADRAELAAETSPAGFEPAEAAQERKHQATAHPE